MLLNLSTLWCLKPLLLSVQHGLSLNKLGCAKIHVEHIFLVFRHSVQTDFVTVVAFEQGKTTVQFSL